MEGVAGSRVETGPNLVIEVVNDRLFHVATTMAWTAAAPGLARLRGVMAGCGAVLLAGGLACGGGAMALPKGYNAISVGVSLRPARPLGRA